MRLEVGKQMTRGERLADYLSLERNVAFASGAVLLLGLGEELWGKFLPKYLEALDASAVVIGLCGTIVFAATVEEQYAS